MTAKYFNSKPKYFFSLVKQAISHSEQDYTKGSIRKAVFLLAVPMVLEMMMESVFAVVDIFFVGKLGKEAVAAVGLTESVLTLVYSVGIGLSMAATAMVARRVGEKQYAEAAHSGMQAMLIGIIIAIIAGLLGLFFAKDVLRLMGASPLIIETGVNYTRIIFAGNIVVILLFLINGIFRGAGNATIAMKSLWLANICNIILCPLLINGWGPFPKMGLTGAAIATTTGRGIGVLYQLYHLYISKGILKYKLRQIWPNAKLIVSLIKIASTGTVQFLIGSASWILLARLIADFHVDAAIAGYQVAIRIILFFLMPAWGMSNAAATLVGQNLGAKQPERAVESVFKTAKYNGIFMLFVSLFFLVFGDSIVRFLNPDVEAQGYAIQALQIISLGYVFYGVGMVLINAFNGAGDTKTPTWINLFCFWAFQIPLAYLLAKQLNFGPKGVFIAIVVAEMLISIVSFYFFRKGNWKTVKI